MYKQNNFTPLQLSKHTSDSSKGLLPTGEVKAAFFILAEQENDLLYFNYFFRLHTH